MFSFSPGLERTGPVGAGTGFYQVTVGPIGAAEPTIRLPSTEVPRYEALLLPDLPDLPGSKTFLFPVDRGIDTQSFTVSNTGDGGAQLTLSAFDDTGDLLKGPDLANERDQRLEARRTLTFDLEAMFGPGATAETVAGGGHRIRERPTGRNDNRDHAGRRLCLTLPGTGGAGLLPVRPARPRRDASRERGRRRRGGFRVPVDTHGRGRRRAGICRAGSRGRRCRPRFPGRAVRH